jgi:site-specific DNA recombinase
VGNVNTLLDTLNFYGVHLYFATDRLNSADPYFPQVFAMKTHIDAQFSKSLGDKVRRGKKGRFLNGYHPGGRSYGYDNLPVEDPSRRVEHGRNAVIGVNQVIIEREAEIVRRIFKSYVAGMSTPRIAKQLNEEGVPPPRNSRSAVEASWCAEAIMFILQNE